MAINWIVLCILFFFLVISYIRHYPLNTRITAIGILLLFSLVLALPILPFSILKFLGLFLLERLWVLLALVLFTEVVINKNNRILMTILGVISTIIYFFFRTMI